MFFVGKGTFLPYSHDKFLWSGGLMHPTVYATFFFDAVVYCLFGIHRGNFQRKNS